MRVLVLALSISFLVLLAIYLRPCVGGTVEPGFIEMASGAGRAYLVLDRVTRPILAVCSGSRNVRLMGAFEIDVRTLEVRWRRGFDPVEAGVQGARVFGSASGDITGGRLLIAEDERWIFYHRRPAGESGTHAVGRRRVSDGSVSHLPMPAEIGAAAEGWVLDYVFGQSPDIVHLVARSHDGSEWRNRTWRGSFRSGEWDEPVVGAFRVIDGEGTLLEIREWRWGTERSRLPPNSIEYVRGGKRGFVDIGTDRPVEPLFGTGHVMYWDEMTEELVLRSLWSGEERRHSP